MALGPDGVVHLVWGTGPYVGRLTYTERSTNGVWTQPEVVDQRIIDLIQMVADRQTGGVHLLTHGWLLLQPFNLAYQGPVVAAQSDTSALTQRLTIPVSMTVPTLSFLYEAGGLTAARPFSVPVGAGGLITITARVKSNVTLLNWLTSTAHLGASGGELETLNNTATVLTQIIGRLFLPVVMMN